MSQIGKWMIFFGAFLIAVGFLLQIAGKIPWVGRLPGDILIRKGNVTFYFPLATGILISIILSVLLSLFLRK